MYQITVHPEHNLIHVKLAGFFDVDEITAYVADLQVTFIRYRLHAGYRMMIDTNECSIQPQNVLAALQKHIAGFPKASRIAMISGSSLARMQVRRVMTQSYMRIFETVEEGEAWLLGPPEQLAQVA